VAAVDDAAVGVQPDRLPQAVGRDVGFERFEFLISHQGEQVGNWMKLSQSTPLCRGQAMGWLNLSSDAEPVSTGST
jgi:hypothetical protein